MLKINVYLHLDRSIPGVMTVRRLNEGDIFLVARCLGKSDNAAAAAHGNPKRDQMLPFGDLPTGKYRGVFTGPGQPKRTYGPHQRIHLVPEEGNAQIAVDNNGRYALQIHGGDLNAKGDLRPTHGCLRVDDFVMDFLQKRKDDGLTIEVREIGEGQFS